MENKELLEAILSNLQNLNNKVEKLDQTQEVLSKDVKEIKNGIKELKEINISIGNTIIDATDNLNNQLNKANNNIDEIRTAASTNSYDIAVLKQKRA